MFLDRPVIGYIGQQVLPITVVPHATSVPSL